MARARAKGKFYAYGEIRYVEDGVSKTVHVGEEVTRGGLGLSEAEWKRRLQRGIIRSRPYPTDIRSTESLRVYNLRKANEAMQSAMDSTYYDSDEVEVEEEPEPEVEPLPAKE